MRMRKKQKVSMILTCALVVGSFAGTGITAEAKTFEIDISSEKMDSGGGELTVIATGEDLKDEVWWTLEKQIPASEEDEAYETVGEKVNTADVDETHTKSEFTVNIPENTEDTNAAYRIRIAETDPYDSETDEYAWDDESEKVVVVEAQTNEPPEEESDAVKAEDSDAAAEDSETPPEDVAADEVPALEEALDAAVAEDVPEASEEDVMLHDTKVPTYHNIPPYQQKDLESSPTVKISGIRIEEVVDGKANGEKRPYTNPITFKIVDTTRQETEAIVEAKDGVLPDITLTENHTYTFYSQDDTYKVVREDGNTQFKLSLNAYTWVDHGVLRNIKQGAETYEYPEFTTLQIAERDEIDLAEDDRRSIYMKVYYKNTDVVLGGVKLKFVSDVETIETTTGSDGRINNVNLLEDVNYIIVVDHSNYDIEAFPLTVKDKSEYRTDKGRPGIRYFYDHSDCHQVEEIRLVDKKDAHINDKTITSLSGNTTASGFNFKDIFLMEKKLDIDLANSLEDKDYDVIDIRTVNPHRWEYAKLATGEFGITEKIDKDKEVKNVYYVDKEDNLHSLPFTCSSDNIVSFTMNSLGVYPVVFEYGNGDVEKVKEDLGNAIKERESYTQEDYTSKSWKAYSAKVDEADILLKGESSTYRQLLRAFKNVESTRNGLVKRVDVVKPETLAALEAAVRKAETVKQSDYKAESRIAFDNALKAAKSLLEDEDATETDCQNAIKELERTQAALVNRNTPKAVKVSKVAINGSSYKVAAGKKIQLTVGVSPINASNKVVGWSSSNVKYATVDSTGKVTTKKAGAGKTVKIIAIAKDGSGKKSECQIRIMKHAVKKISLKAKKTVKAGKKLTVKATVKTTGKSANKKLTWTSSNTKYATVNSKGKVSTKKAGKGKKVKITAAATDGSGKKKTVTIKIK